METRLVNATRSPTDIPRADVPRANVPRANWAAQYSVRPNPNVSASLNQGARPDQLGGTASTSLRNRLCPNRPPAALTAGNLTQGALTQGAGTQKPATDFRSRLSQFVSPSGAPNGRANDRPYDRPNVHEEKLQHGLVSVLLESKAPQAFGTYQSAFAQARGNGASDEDSVKSALQAAVASGELSSDSAETINGMSFQAAQLDGDLTALFDDRGSASDKTIAIAPLEEALSRAENSLNAIMSGSVQYLRRSLGAPSNAAGVSASVLSAASRTPDSTALSPAAAGPGEATGLGSVPASEVLRADALDGFLWKPKAERDGNLVVLLPPGLTGSVANAAIYSSLPPNSQNFLEEGRYANIGNGNRTHFRFSKPGDRYPDGAYVVARLTDGSSVAIQIGESSARN